jgi:hypothetical protein
VPGANDRPDRTDALARGDAGRDPGDELTGFERVVGIITDIGQIWSPGVYRGAGKAGGLSA